MHCWFVAEGRSLASVTAKDIEGAIARAAAIGFEAPTSVCLDDDGAIYRRHVDELHTRRPA